MEKEQQYIYILKAHIDKKTIEYREKDTKEWHFKPVYYWNFSKYEYRIKPEPKEIWMIKGGQRIFNSKNDIIDHCCLNNTSITQIIHFKEVV